MTFEFTLTHSTDQEARILGVWHREVEESVGEHVKERLEYAESESMERMLSSRAGFHPAQTVFSAVSLQI